MDYFKLLKRAWDITWRYKALWVLGLFVGAVGGSSGTGGSGSFPDGASQDAYSSMDRAVSWAADNVMLIAVVAAVVVIISLAWWILMIAAQGGIAYGTNEAAEERAPSLGAAWSAGFAKWGRTFMVQFVLGLPVLLVVAVMAGLFAVFGITAASGDGAAAAGVGLCLFFPLLLVVIVVASVIIGILSPVAIRYGVLQDVSYGQAIRRAWDDLWGKKGLVVFWLVMLLPGIAYGLAVFAIVLVAIIPAVVAIIAEQYIIAGVLGVLMLLLLMVPNAIYATFVHAAWTLMFRHISGMEQPSPAPSAAVGTPADRVATPTVPTVPSPPSMPGSSPPVPPQSPPPGSDV